MSLGDWEMRSDRNGQVVRHRHVDSLGDWEMRSDRNARIERSELTSSLGDWEMRSDRNKNRVVLAVKLSLGQR
jgi:hypothetical protein